MAGVIFGVIVWVIVVVAICLFMKASDYESRDGHSDSPADSGNDNYKEGD